AGYENQIKDLDADIEVNRKLVKAKLLLVDQLNEEAGQMEKMRQDAKSASAAGLAQSGGITNEAILRIAEELSRRNFGTGGNQIGNFAALGVEGSLERDIAQAIAGIRVHAAGVDNTAFLKEVLAALRELAASHKLNAEQLAAANAEISNIIGTIAAHGPRY
ncbi:MAG TPA: hypothetical protein VN765_08335, partial [Candidatus Acidoferrum sp.]|nr:hypothetical protein [Candidatus Acidoferrum sp.]